MNIEKYPYNDRDINHCLAWLGLKGIDVFTVNKAVFVRIENQDIMIHPYEIRIKAQMYRKSVNYHGTH
jgi:hypothetical protein